MVIAAIMVGGGSVKDGCGGGDDGETIEMLW